MSVLLELSAVSRLLDRSAAAREVASTAMEITSRARRAVAGRDVVPHASELDTLMDAARGRPSTIPGFVDGHLPAGIHDAELGEFALRFANNRYRMRLMQHLHEVMRLHAKEGVDHLYVGGSFVTKKARPGDVDVLYGVTDYATGADDYWDYGIHVMNGDERGVAEFSKVWRGKDDPSMFEFLQRNRAGTPVGIMRVRLPLDHERLAARANANVARIMANSQGTGIPTPDQWIRFARSGDRPHREAAIAAYRQAHAAV